MALFPNKKQIVGSSACGPVTLLNVYSHFGIETNLEEVMRELKTNSKKSTYSGQLAKNFMEHGLETIIVTSSPRLVAPNWKGLDPIRLNEKLATWTKKNRKDKWIKNVNHLLAYVKNKGRVEITDLTLSVLDKYLDSGYLIIPCLEDSWIWGQRKIKGKAEFDDIRGKPTGHFVVIYGKEGDDYLVSDPYPTGLKDREGLYKINKDKLLVATLFWSATIIVVKNKK